MMAKRCNISGCRKKVYAVGLCNADYQAYWKLVKTGQTTWEELQKLGIADRPQKDEPSPPQREIERRRRTVDR